MADHASFLEALILTAVLPPRFVYVAEQELLHRPLAAIPMRRGEAWRPHYSVLKVYIEKPISSVGEDWPAALPLRDSARRQILAQSGEPDAAG